MFRFLSPIILVGIAVAGFFMFTKPFYTEVSDLRSQVSAYNEALDNSKSLESERDKLTQKYNSLDKNSLLRLERMLPDSVDNIKLILELEKLAIPYGMVLKDVKYDTTSEKDIANANGTAVAAKNSKNSAVQQDNKDYGTWELEFSTQGSYFDFLNFVKDIEKNLRIVDIASVQFASVGGTGLATNQPANNYKYTFKIRTYWLKN
jgi:Tfp pilus assembly protein PilO